MARTCAANKYLFAGIPALAFPFTMAAWANSTSIASTQSVLGLGTFAGSNTHTKIALISSAAAAEAQINGGSADDSAASSSLSSNTWYHLCAVFTAATSRSIYVNGAGKVTSVVSVAAGGQLIAILGAQATGSAQIFLIGAVAFASYWKIALSDSDVLSLAQTASPRLIHPEAIVSYARLTGNNSPEPDLILSAGWTLSGPPTESANPPIFLP